MEVKGPQRDGPTVRGKGGLVLIGTRKCEGSLRHGGADTDRLSVSAALRSLGTRRDSAACLDSQIGEAVKEKSFQTPTPIQMPPFKCSCRQ